MSVQKKPVVTGSRKRFQKNAKIAPGDSPDKGRSTRAVGPVYDAGGGSGFDNLNFEALKTEHENMYKRTLSTTVLADADVEQGDRQLTIADEYITYIVTIAREDFPSKSCDLEVRFTPNALQSAWSQFLVDARVALDVEFIDTIVDRMDGAPVNRMMGLRNGGQYFLRQREASAIMEVIQSGKLPEQVSWNVTSGINIAKDNLKESGTYQGVIDDKIDHIITQPMLRDQQRETTYAILEAEEAGEIIEAMWEVLNSHDLPPEEYAIAMEAKMRWDREVEAKEKERQERLDYLIKNGGDPKEILKLSQGAHINTGVEEGFGGVSTKTHDKEVDIVSLYRLSFETISRLAIRNVDTIPEMANTVIDFVEKTMDKYRHEVDIVVLGSSCLSNLVRGMIPHRKRAYTLLMDNIQAYAPANDSFRPTRIVRRLLSPDEAQRQEEEWEKQFTEEGRAELEAELNKSQSAILDEVKQVGDEEEKFDLEAYLAELEEKKKAAEEAERARLAALAAAAEEESSEEEEEVEVGPKRKAPWSGTVGAVGKLKPEEVQYASIYDEAPDDGKKKKKLLKGFKPFSGSRPLPVVPGIMFRGLVGPYKSDMAMLQCFSSLFAFINSSFGNREEAFQMHIAEEISAIGLVCIGNPRLLEYSMWVIDAMYGDGFMIDLEDEDTIALTEVGVSDLDGSTTGGEPPRMNPDGTLARVAEGEEDNNHNNYHDMKDDGSGLEMELDLASTITQPSVDLEGKNQLLKEDINVNLGNPKAIYDDVFPDPSTLPLKTPKDDLTEIVVDGEEKDRQARTKAKEARQQMVENGLVKEELGEELYEYRYKRRPRDPVVLFCAMCMAHYELGDKEKEMARKWIGVWDDASSRFKRLVVIGQGLSGLT